MEGKYEPYNVKGNSRTARTISWRHLCEKPATRSTPNINPREK